MCALNESLLFFCAYSASAAWTCLESHMQILSFSISLCWLQQKPKESQTFISLSCICDCICYWEKSNFHIFGSKTSLVDKCHSYETQKPENWNWLPSASLHSKMSNEVLMHIVCTVFIASLSLSHSTQSAATVIMSTQPPPSQEVVAHAWFIFVPQSTDNIYCWWWFCHNCGYHHASQQLPKPFPVLHWRFHTAFDILGFIQQCHLSTRVTSC